MFFAYVITEGAQIINFDLRLKSIFISIHKGLYKERVKQS
ncbi:hypothetical protein NEIMUCOT_06054 [Neisseria mucosa ATCC 25996]|uniref:Uncharacterized protein n=1 Tax=Neisseria mucosa (strain ATCC 25996 / DSM 4631 / NCTC 10774 / M26) TaxID=546266 RepID=D2ZZH7_NEIM2|nr:hypothetical protein NEIMUCOT_06054 [Neisseria mucosa ATCC 25996]